MWSKTIAKIPTGLASRVLPGSRVPSTGVYRSTKSHELAVMVKDEVAPTTQNQDEVWVQAYDTAPKRKIIWTKIKSSYNMTVSCSLPRNSSQIMSSFSI